MTEDNNIQQQDSPEHSKPEPTLIQVIETPRLIITQPATDIIQIRSDTVLDSVITKDTQ